MAIIPTNQAMGSVAGVMAKSLSELYRIIETQCDHDNPKIAMVLMIAFMQGITLQLRDKIESLEPGLGGQLLSAVNEITEPDSKGREILDKLSTNDPSLGKSASKIAPDDLPGAVDFLVKKLLGDIHTHLEELPFLLRNEAPLMHSLSLVVARILQETHPADLDDAIDMFSENIRAFACS